MSANCVAIALVHHPVVNKIGETIGSAVTNLDIHDIARVSRTYGIGQYFITTPYDDQQKLVDEIIDHWQTGHGSTYNPARKEAFSIVSKTKSVEEVIEILEAKHGTRPQIIATTAKMCDNTLDYQEISKKIDDGQPILLLFGTAHGLAPEIMNSVDYVLPPIEGGTDYNHLPVRAAVAIIMDRLLGRK
ncbi:MAG: RNA methyltransferase [Desulfotalea sp.]